MHQFIDEGDETFVKIFYEMAKVYMSQSKKDRMIEEGEEDLDMDRTHTLKEAREMLKRR